MDYEAQLEKIIPRLSWQACTNTTCPIVERTMRYKARMVVPSDYKDLEGASFYVTVFKYTSIINPKYNSHVTILAGGPGGSHYNEVGNAEMWTVSSAAYLFNHRGMDESGEFASSNMGSTDIIENIERIVNNGPFPVKDLTVRNAALDVGLLMMAIKRNDGYTEGQTVGIDGFSYGSTWGSQVVKLLPNLLDFAFLGGIPSQEAERHDTLRGIAENCALDAFCRKEMGGHVYEEFLAGIRDIMNDDGTNECTKAFTAKAFFEFEELPDRKKLEKLSWLFLKLSEEEGTPKVATGLSRIQLAIPFVKATRDCVNPSTYVREILEPLLPYFGVKTDPLDIQGDRFSSWVNMVVAMDAFKIDHCRGCDAHYVEEAIDPHRDHFYCDIYDNRFNALLPYLGGMEFSDNSPFVTSRTKVLIGNGRMDDNTPYESAWKLFQSVSAREKIWYLSDNRGHVSLDSSCYYDIVLYYTGTTTNIDEQSIRKCLEETNKKESLDWRFLKEPKWQKLWAHMKSGEAEIPPEKQLMPIPNFAIVRDGSAHPSISYRHKDPISGSVAAHRGKHIPYDLASEAKAPSGAGPKPSEAAPEPSETSPGPAMGGAKKILGWIMPMVVMGIMVGLFLWWWLRRRRREREQQQHQGFGRVV